ncbi:hypothetical protein F7Q99_09450 [Streptomyces kaniharaensis]|uniref:Uncharacterized protein n=1 Tax=Streptomyces kaniharaensis TaxID=212423 RepID=A0A6N7KSB2_9ACTN|nr:hypothetical protein [Streptomyces kaniharaensis]
MWRASSAPYLASPWVSSPRAADDTSEITVASLWLSQAELWYWGQDSLLGTKPLRIVYISGHIGLFARMHRTASNHPQPSAV